MSCWRRELDSGADPPPLVEDPAAHIEDRELELRLRRADPVDLAFLVDLIGHPDVEPFLAAVSPRTPDELSAEIERGREEPAHFGRLIAEVGPRDNRALVGSIAYEAANRRSRIAYLSALAVRPEASGRGLGTAISRLAVEHLVRDVGYHRVQCEIYAFNERAIDVAERAGMRREGIRRRAYWRRGRWVDGVLFGVLADELLA